jgi:hypothetical protein
MREYRSAEAVGRLWHLGKRYVLGRAAHNGAFHPKVLLRIGATEGAIMIGSGNLTSCGWGGHKELGCGWLFGPNHADSGAWLHPFLDEVTSWCASDLEKEGSTSSGPKSPEAKKNSAGGHKLRFTVLA